MSESSNSDEVYSAIQLYLDVDVDNPKLTIADFRKILSEHRAVHDAIQKTSASKDHLVATALNQVAILKKSGPTIERPPAPTSLWFKI
jgi:hypothetical protein